MFRFDPDLLPRAVFSRLLLVHAPKDHRGVDLISDALPFGRLWYSESNATSNAISYAMHYSRSHDAVIETHEHKGQFKEC
jgi:hypothetical protein